MLKSALNYFKSKKLLKDILAQNNEENYLFSDILKIHKMFADKESKKLFRELLSGYRSKNLPDTNAAYISDTLKISQSDKGYGAIDIPLLNKTLPLLDLNQIGFKIKLNTDADATAAFFLQQYMEDGFRDNLCIPVKNDVVIDFGSNWGNSTLYFSHQVGKHGKVYSFSDKDNIEILKNNINYNPHLSTNINIVDIPFSQISIDEYVKRQELERVDYIKFEWGSFDPKTLLSAETTFIKFTPKLAIDFSGKSRDFINLLNYFRRLRIHYKLIIVNCISSNWRVMLFAIPKREK